MLWEVDVKTDSKDAPLGTTKVEAKNWFSALNLGLIKIEGKEIVVSNISCDIKPDGSVLILDFISRKKYELRPLNDTGKSSAIADKTEEILDSSKKKRHSNPPSQIELSDGLVKHKVFFTKDECDDGSNIFYRERLIAIDENTVHQEAGILAFAYYEQLKGMETSPDAKLFLSIHIFDHVFDKVSKRPAVAALTWKEWSPKKPKIFFPMSGQRATSISRIPGVVVKSQKERSAPLKEKEKKPETASKSKKVTNSLKIKSKTSKNAPVKKAKKTEQKKKPVARQRKITPPPMSAMDDKMVVAFEKMEKIYSVKGHDEVARFTLELAKKLIPCEAGSCMLISPGKFELYISAAFGPVASKFKKKTLPMNKGIVGFATRNSAVITINDPENDPRFDRSMDMKSGFKTRNIACSPMQYEGHTIGVIEIMNSSSKKGFSDKDTNVLSYVCGAAAEYVSTSLPSREKDFTDEEFYHAENKNIGRTSSPEKQAGKSKKQLIKKRTF